MADSISAIPVDGPVPGHPVDRRRVRDGRGRAAVVGPLKSSGDPCWWGPKNPGESVP